RCIREGMLCNCNGVCARGVSQAGCMCSGGPGFQPETLRLWHSPRTPQLPSSNRTEPGQRSLRLIYVYKSHDDVQSATINNNNNISDVKHTHPCLSVGVTTAAQYVHRSGTLCVCVCVCMYLCVCE